MKILLTELIPQLLELVDNGKMGMRPAVELSYLDKDDKALVYELMLDCVCTPSHAQAIMIRRLAEKEILAVVYYRLLCFIVAMVYKLESME